MSSKGWQGQHQHIIRCLQRIVHFIMKYKTWKVCPHILLLNDPQIGTAGEFWNVSCKADKLLFCLFFFWFFFVFWLSYFAHWSSLHCAKHSRRKEFWVVVAQFVIMLLLVFPYSQTLITLSQVTVGNWFLGFCMSIFLFWFASQVISGSTAEWGPSLHMNLEGQQRLTILERMEKWFWWIPANLEEERKLAGHSHLTRSLVPQLHKV